MPKVADVGDLIAPDLELDRVRGKRIAGVAMHRETAPSAASRGTTTIDQFLAQQIVPALAA
ncbi:MAG: hypothetical protein WKG01_25610 [Kofleriaceae bacterium]